MTPMTRLTAMRSPGQEALIRLQLLTALAPANSIVMLASHWTIVNCLEAREKAVYLHFDAFPPNAPASSNTTTFGHSEPCDL